MPITPALISDSTSRDLWWKQQLVLMVLLVLVLLLVLELLLAVLLLVLVLAWQAHHGSCFVISLRTLSASRRTSTSS
jgi:hypothetical protein